LENKKQLMIIVGAVVAGIVAVFLTSNYVKNSIQSQTAALSEQYEVKQKEMAAQMQQKSEQQVAALTQQIERVRNEDAENLKKQMMAMQAEQQRQARIVEQQAQQRALQVKQVVRKPSLALKTPVGKRAVTVKIDSLAAVGGLLNAGDFVDVIAQLTVPNKDATAAEKKTVTAMIFQGLQVLAINTNEEDLGAYDEQQAMAALKITFAVDPQEAGLLAFADKNGTLELALRSPDDTEHKTLKANTWKTLADYVLQNQGADIQNLDEEQEAESKQGPQEKQPNIQIFRGGKEL
jgi:Flp pilus assembly protein CpaB